MSENRSRAAAGGRPPQRPQSGMPQGQRNGQPVKRRPQPRRHRSRRHINLRFIIFLAVVAILAVGCGILIFSLTHGADDAAANSGNVQSQPAATQDSGDIKLAGDPGVDIDDTDDDSDDVVAPVLSDSAELKVEDLHITEGLDSNWLNVLLLGSDQRTPNEAYRTDTMMICSINKSTGEVKLTSIMRDTAMYMGEFGDQSGLYRMNVACYAGGPEYLMQFLNDNLNLNISSYVMVDFTSFSTIAEKLGGIEIDISQAEMEEINYNLHRQAKVAYESGMTEEEIYATYVYLEEYGENVHLNGPQVLGYARIRKLDTDSLRTERQRKVLIAMLEKLRTRTPQEIMSLAMSLGGYVTTNMSIDDIITVALVVVNSDMEVEQLRLPVIGSYVQETRDGEAMLYDTNWETNATEVHEFIYGN